MSKTKVLLIGGSSDLGRELAKVLPYEFTNFDIQNQNSNVSNFILGSLTSLNDLNKLSSTSFDSVVHISGVHPILSTAKDEELMKLVNVDGVKNVLESVKTAKFIFISSSSASKTNSFYGQTKVQAESLVEEFSKKINTPSFALRTKGFTPYYSSSYKNFKNYANWVLTGAVHILDVVKAVDLCIKSNSTGYEMFVVDGKQDFSKEELNNWSKEMLSLKYPEAQTLINELVVSDKAPSYSNPSNTVGYKPDFGFSKVIQEYIKQKDTP